MRRVRFLSVFLVLSFLIAPLAAESCSAASYPSVSAKGAVLIDANTGKIICEQNAHAKLAMASTTKIMTALLALEQPDIDEYFLVDPEAILVEGTSMGLQTGDSVTLRGLAVGMLLPSGNDAANAAAVKIGGSLEGFCAIMNERAASLGMDNTHFVTPSGLDDENHFSSAYDMALLGAEAIKNPAFLNICSQKKATVMYGAPPYARTLYNHNRLLSTIEGAAGIKTGFTKKAGRCLVSAVTRGTFTLICVTLGAGDDWNAHKQMYSYGFSLLSGVLPDVPALPAHPVVGGVANSVSVVTTEPPELLLFSAAKDEITTKILLPRFSYAPLNAGDEIGKVEYYYKDILITSAPIVCAGSCEALPPPVPEKKSFWQKIWDFIVNLFS